MNKEDDFMSDYDNAISGLPRHRKQSRRTTRARTGFYTAGNAASPKKRILQRARAFSGVTATRKNVTASANAGKSRKPPKQTAATGRKWNG